VGSQSLTNLLLLFNIDRKREVEAHCRKTTIRSEALADLLLTARVAGIGDYRYACHFADITPPALVSTQSELAALGSSGLGETQSDARRAISKINQLFIDRRILAAHLFFSPSKRFWHLFYFDQRDFQQEQNHWVHGPHIHYSRESFTNDPLDTVWSKVCLAKPEFPKSVHIRYDYHHNRRRKRIRPSNKRLERP